VIDTQLFSVELPNGTTVRPLSGQVTIDETWSPFIQASIVIEEPADLTPFDPRLSPPPRVRVNAAQYFWNGTTGAFSVTPDSSESWNLHIRESVRTADHTLTLTLASDEALLQDYSQMFATVGPGMDFVTFPSELHTVIDYVTHGPWGSLTSAGVVPTANFVETTPAVDLSPFNETVGLYTGIVWRPGVSAWSFVSEYLQRSGRRLWVDPDSDWHISLEPKNTAGTIYLHDAVQLTNYSSTISRDDWYDGVAIVYTWSPDAKYSPSLSHVDLATSGSFYRGRTHVETIQLAPAVGAATPAAAVFDGMATYKLDRMSALGRSETFEAVSNFDAKTGMALSVSIDGGTVTGHVASVTWNIGTRRMTVTGRDMV